MAASTIQTTYDPQKDDERKIRRLLPLHPSKKQSLFRRRGKNMMLKVPRRIQKVADESLVASTRYRWTYSLKASDVQLADQSVRRNRHKILQVPRQLLQRRRQVAKSRGQHDDHPAPTTSRNHHIHSSRNPLPVPSADNQHPLHLFLHDNLQDLAALRVTQAMMMQRRHDIANEHLFTILVIRHG